MYKNSIFLRLRNKNQVYIVDYFNDGFRLHLSGGKRPFLENLKIEDVIEYLEKHLLMKSETAKKLISNINIKLIDDYNINGDFIESQAFAFLAIRRFLELPISFPDTTGCKSPTIGGEIVKNF